MGYGGDRALRSYRVGGYHSPENSDPDPADRKQPDAAGGIGLQR